VEPASTAPPVPDAPPGPTPLELLLVLVPLMLPPAPPPELEALEPELVLDAAEVDEELARPPVPPPPLPDARPPLPAPPAAPLPDEHAMGEAASMTSAHHQAIREARSVFFEPLPIFPRPDPDA
jgi:hypothetical protein